MTSNNAMRIIRDAIIASVLYSYVCTATLYPTVLHLDQLCGKTVTVNGDVRLAISEKTYLPSNTFCALTLKPDKGTALVANFRKFSIDPKYRNSIDECQVEAVQLTWPGGDYFGDRGYCGSGRPGDQYMLGNLGTLSYTTWNGIHILTADVDLLVSEIFYKTDVCPKGTFDCGIDSLCIDEDLTCNGYKDCGNGSYEGAAVLLQSRLEL
ncbi:unnamed protein product [Lymnaea stagnalis]|uniref:CUB domain-containing protein n=1 Tax=Lymnaea stagnalis TaxID=6523 RepID=A0AAV2HI26_LYMST